MKKMFFFAMFVATAMTCAAENESENNAVVMNAAPETEEIAAAEPETENVAEVILNDIDPVVTSSFYVNEDRQVFFIEVGERFIRVKDYKTHKLVYTISKYLATENGTWVNGANSVMEFEGRYYPARRILNGKGITYKGAKHRQYVSMKRVRSVEREYQIWL